MERLALRRCARRGQSAMTGSRCQYYLVGASGVRVVRRTLDDGELGN